MGDGFEGFGVFTEGFQGGGSDFGEAFGFFFSFFETEDGWVGGFFCFEIFSGAFSELFAGLGDVENVVNDLEGESEGLTEAGEVFEFFRGGVSRHGTEADGGGDKGGGFILMDVAKLGWGNFFTFAFDVNDLTSDECLATAGLGKFRNNGLHGVAFSGGGAGGDGEGFGEECVSSEYGGTFSEYFMGGGFSATKVVIIHAGKVVVDEGVGVNAFYGAGEGKGVFDFPAEGFGRGDA